MSDVERYASQYKNLTLIFNLNPLLIYPKEVIPSIKRLREAHSAVFGECSGLMVTKHFFENTRARLLATCQRCIQRRPKGVNWLGKRGPCKRSSFKPVENLHAMLVI